MSLQLPQKGTKNAGWRSPSFARDAEFREDDVKRDEGGKFAKQGGSGGGETKAESDKTEAAPAPKKTNGGGTHPGHGYSQEAKVHNGTIHTTNVNDAVRALWEGRKVAMEQPHQVSTLVSKLGDIAKRAEKLGGKAPNFDLCNVSVEGTNLFCAETKGIPRVKMPQLPDEKGPAFQKFLADKGFKSTEGKEKVSFLKATQSELVGAKVSGIMGFFRNRDPSEDAPLFVSRDNYIVDGHHRWAARVGLDAEKNMLGNVEVKIVRVDLPIIELLAEAETFTEGKGHKAATANDMALDAALRSFLRGRMHLLAMAFDKAPFKEEDVKRDDGGKFAEQAGGGAGEATEAPKEEKAPEPPKAKKGRVSASAAGGEAAPAEEPLAEKKPPPAAKSESYISPNIAEGLHIPDAIQGLQGVRQRALTKVSSQIDRALGLTTVKEVDCVGAWADGAENTLMVINEAADPALERAAAAMKGHLAGQKAVLLFHPDKENGTTAMATFLIKGSMSHAHDELLKEGLEFHTLEKTPDGTRVHIFVDNQDNVPAITDAAKRLGGRPKFVRGQGEFIGTDKSDGTGEEQRADARRVYESVIEEAHRVSAGLGRRNVRDVWQDAHNHWRAAIERESAEVGSQQAGVTPQPAADKKPPAGPKLTPLKGSAAGSHPATISSRLPTNVGADTTTYQRADTESMKATPSVMRKGVEVNVYKGNVALLREARDYPNLRPEEADQSDDKVVDSFKKHLKDNLTFLYNNAPKSIREHGPEWYEGANGIAETQGARYNLPVQSVAGVYASQSPQKLWDMNVYLGDRILDIYHTQQDHTWDDEMDDTADDIWHKPDPARDAALQTEINAIRGKKLSECKGTKEKAQWIRTYDQAHSNMMFQAVASDGTRGDAWRWPPEEGQDEGDIGIATWQSTHQVENAIKCIESNGDRDIISGAMGEQHKVRCFYNNILDPHSGNGDNTVDTHAVGAALLRGLGASAIPVMHSLATTPANAAKAREIGFVPAKGSQVSGVQGLYPFYADAYREAAKDLGIEPRTLQSVVWEAKRLMFGLRPPQALVDDVEAAWRSYHDGKADLKKTQKAVIDAARKHNPKGGFFG